MKPPQIIRNEPILIEEQNFNRPSWKAYGEGIRRIEIRIEKSGGLSIVASEYPVENGDVKRGKEVFANLSKEATALLREKLNSLK